MMRTINEDFDIFIEQVIERHGTDMPYLYGYTADRYTEIMYEIARAADADLLFASQETLNKFNRIMGELIDSSEGEAPYDIIRRLIAETTIKPTVLGYVYLLRTPGQWWKIGYTSNPERRYKTLVKLPFEHVEYECLIHTDNMTQLEQTLHNKFASKRSANRSEFFKLEPADIEYITELAKTGVYYDHTTTPEA